MSTFNKIDVTCGDCGEAFTGILWTAVHAGEDPILKDILLGGELNILMCPKCSHAAYRDHFVLYQDPKAELIAYIYPPDRSGEEEFLRKTMLVSFKEAQQVLASRDRKDYDPILVFGLATFVELMQEENARAEQSQIAEAICKEKGIPYFILRPSEARRLKTMRVIPGTRGEKNAIANGFQSLFAANPSLELYRDLLSKEDLFA
jgi:CpXC protein